MVRLIAAILFTCCLTLQVSARVPKQVPQQAPQEEGSPQKQQPGSVERKQQESPEKTPLAAPAKTSYPLDAFTDFSAVMVGSFLPRDTREAHIYRSGKLLRMEGPEEIGYYVTNLADQDTYHVWDTGCQHGAYVYLRAAPWAAASRPGYKVERVAAGKEMMDGHSSQVEDVTLTSPELSRPMKLRLWEAEDLQGFPIRIEFNHANGSKHSVRYKNVVLGSQDPTLFIHPKPCRTPPQGTKKPAAVPKDKTPAPKDKTPAPPPANAPK